jgi:hypothetical protein
VARRSLGTLAKAAVLFVALASPALVPIAIDRGSTTKLSEHRQFELVAIVRSANQLLYRAFSHVEYTQTGLWLVALAGCVFLVRPRIVGRVFIVSALTAAVLCGLGAAASQAGKPLLLVQVQTSRLSPFFVLFGIVTAAGALTRYAPRVAPLLLLVVPLLASPLSAHLAANPRGGDISESGVEAVLLLLLVVAAVAVVAFLQRYPMPPRRVLYGSAAAAAAAIIGYAGWLVSENRFRTSLNATEGRWVLILVLVAAAASGAVLSARQPVHPGLLRGIAGVAAVLVLYNAGWLVHENRFRTDFGQTQAEKDWSDVAAHARAASSPLQLSLTPPDQDGFRFFAHRPVVVEFGTFRYDRGIDEWVKRMDDVTGSPRVLSPALGTNVALRVPLIAAAYQHLVVTHAPFKPPPWLTPLYANTSFDLFRVKPGTCAAHA